jgi:hypothetical protein
MSMMLNQVLVQVTLYAVLCVAGYWAMRDALSLHYRLGTADCRA